MTSDASGNQKCYDYKPFGDDLQQDAGNRPACYPAGGSPEYPAPPDQQSLKFTGKERDAETGLDYFGARYLSSAQGRWMSPDWSATPQAVPYADLSDPQTLNLYSYVRNNPLANPDPDGHAECFINGACNFLRNVLPNATTTGGAIVNAIGNTVSDLLSLDEVVKGSVDVVQAETTIGRVGVALGLVGVDRKSTR